MRRALTCVSEPPKSLRAHAVRASEDALHNGDHGLMLVGSGGRSSGFLVRGGDIRKQVARVPFADDLEVRQCDKKRLANTKSGRAVRIAKACMFGHGNYPFHCTLARRENARPDAHWS